MTEPAASRDRDRHIYVTLSGLPLLIKLEWPFHQSASGADFWVLHGDVQLANSDGLHAPVAVNLSATVREVLPSLEAGEVEGPVINALRKEVDRRQLEFLKSGKLVPVHFSSRYYDFQRNRWVFGRASDEEITKLLARKVYWQSRLLGGNAWIADPAEALYVERPLSDLSGLGMKLSESGLMTISGEWASATAALLRQTEQFEAEMKEAQAELDRKHAFEDGRKPA
jgi:hypothetical protein